MPGHAQSMCIYIVDVVELLAGHKCKNRKKNEFHPKITKMDKDIRFNKLYCDDISVAVCGNVS